MLMEFLQLFFVVALWKGNKISFSFRSNRQYIKFKNLNFGFENQEFGYDILKFF